MQTIRHTNPQANPGFQPIPTRIKDLVPLIIDPLSNADEGVKGEVTASLVALSGNLAAVHRTAAEAYTSQGMYDQAVLHMETAVRFASSSIEYRNQLGFVAYLAGNDDLAVMSFQKVIAANPQQTEAHFNLGMVLFGGEKYEAAEQCFSSALAVDSNDAQGWNNRGVCLFKLDRKEEALSCFKNALQIDACDDDAKFNIALIEEQE